MVFTMIFKGCLAITIQQQVGVAADDFYSQLAIAVLVDLLATLIAQAIRSGVEEFNKMTKR